MKLKMRSLLVISAFALLLGGCRKNDKSLEDSIENDFQGVRGTMSDSSVAGIGKEFEVNTSAGIVKIKFDVNEIDSKISKIFPAKRYEVDEKFIENLAAKVFDNGEYENVTYDAKEGELIVTMEHASGLITERCELQGTMNGQKYSLLYSYSYSNVGDVTVNNDLSIMLVKTTDEGQIIDMNFNRISDEICEGNTCNYDETLFQAEELIKKLGYDNYELVYDANVVEPYTDNMRQGTGYCFVFRKKIDGTCGKWYLNNCYYKPDDYDGAYYEYIEVFVTAEGILYLDINDMYEVDEESPISDSVVLGIEEAMTVAEEQIKMMINKADEAGQLATYGTFEQIDISVELAYVPMKYGEEVAYMPVYLFTANLSEDEYNPIVVVAVSGLDGEVVICYYYYDPAVLDFEPSLG